MKEIWVDVKGYEGLYQISNIGRVKSYHYDKNGKILKLQINEDGYYKVTLNKNKNKKTYSVHRLVAIHFIDNPNNYSEINHKDENKQNNNFENLEWCSRKYNVNYGTGRKRQREKMIGKKFSEEHKKKLSKSKNNGNKHPQAKKIKCITTGEIFSYIKEASNKYNIDNSSITKCCKGKYKYAGIHPATGEKLKWEYWEGK